MKPYILKKEYEEDYTYTYVEYDEERDLHVIKRENEIGFSIGEYEYLETDRQLMFYINTVIKDGEVEIISSENVKGCPEELTGYFIS